MSGGYYDYFYSKVNTFIEEVEEDIESVPTSYRNISLEELEAIKYLKQLAVHLAEASYLAEWWLSGDTGSQSFVSYMSKLKNESSLLS